MKKQFSIYYKIITSDYHSKTATILLHDATYEDVLNVIEQLKKKHAVHYIGVWEGDVRIIGGM